MRSKTLKIDGKGTIYKIKAELYGGTFEAEKPVSIYVDHKGLLVIYVGAGTPLIKIPMKKVMINESH